MHRVMHMTRKSFQISGKFLSSLAISSGILLAALDVQAAVSQSPLSLTIGVPPNLILTLDDSSSMDRAYVPDSIPGGGSTRRYNSADYNPMYYNPAVTYRIPPSFNSDGTQATAFTTSFTAARRNGFNSSRGTVNLSTSYRSTYTYTVTSSSNGSEGNNPVPDFYLSFNQSGVNLTAGATSGIYTRNGVDYRLTRASSGSGCSVTVVSPQNYPAISCTRSSSTSTTYQLSIPDRRTTGVPAYYYVYDNTLTDCTQTKTDDNCYRKIDVSSTSGRTRSEDPIAGTDERQNFAIWYSFYRSRNLATVSAASMAFADLSSSTRLTWQGLTDCTTLNSNNCNNNRFREYTTAQRGRLFGWMQNMTFPGNTPLRAALDRAGKFLQTDTAWHKYPNESGNTDANTYACRPSYHILMTDGIWNSSNGNPTNTLRADHSNFTLPDGTSYANRRPYVDGTQNTLADLAMHYWATDLRANTSAGGANDLKPYILYKSGNSTTDYWDARNNPATWQHMVNFTVGLGLSGSLNQAGLEWDSERGALGGTAYNNLVSGARQWPAASSDSVNNVYDLWHAAINSRGDFFSADSPESVIQAFADIMSRISADKSTASRPAMNSGQVTEDENNNGIIKTVSYHTTYASIENWSGDLIRTEKERSFNSVTGLPQDTLRTAWRASEQMPAPSSRRIYIPTSNSNGLQAFTWNNAGNPNTEGTLAHHLRRNPENGSLDNATKGEERLNYLRGVRTGEGTTYRTRSSILGDLYSSTPVGVSKARYLVNIANRTEGNTAYASFAQSVLNRKGMVYVGGNDGMLHGFNSQTGREEFAFIPSAVFPNLNKLTGNNYSHHFYVDGSPVAADVYDNGTWKTILVGTLRAGGKSIFALDVTDPDNIRLLWEFDDRRITGTNAVKMGYSFSKPTVARLNTGRWAVVFGNGYEAQNHTNGKAALFVLDAVNGTLLKSLEVEGTEGLANGLSTPKLSDYNADGITEFAYAGDLQGNLWRFNLHSNSANSFSVAYGGKPMFSAVADSAYSSKRQPITAAPSLVRHPSGNGYLVIFGTGKYFEDGDKDGDKSMAQTLYGIWDRYTRLINEDISASNGAITINRSRLVAQTIDTATTATNRAGKSMDARTMSDNHIAWYNNEGGVDKLGWRLDFKQGAEALDGEMLVDDMATLGRSLFLQTLVPNDDPCADGASNWTYAINPHSGGRLRHNALILTAPTLESGVFPSGQQQSGEGGLTISQKPDGNFEVCTGTTCNDIRPDPASIGRQSWRLVDEIEE